MRQVAVKIRFRAIETGRADSVLQAVELHRGAVVTTVGRVSGVRQGNGRVGAWTALRVAGYHWTGFHGTRAAAVAEMLGYGDEALEGCGAFAAGVRYHRPTYAVIGCTLRECVERALAWRPARLRVTLAA